MRRLKFTLIIMALSAMTFTLTSCNSGNKSGEKTEKSVDKSGPEYTSAYVCPMHCKGSGSHEAGKCSVCGMDLVKNKDHEMHKEGSSNEMHDHAVSYACSMHPEVTGKAGDKCSKCGMDLTPVEGEDHSGHDHE